MKKPENAARTSSLIFYVAFGLAVLIAGLFYRAELIEALYSLEQTVDELDHWGPLLMLLVASLWAILCLPGPVILGFLGTVFSSEPFLALAVAVAADSVAEAVGFVLARHFGRDYVTSWLEKKPWFQWLEDQTAERGAYAVFVIRMMPFFPNSLANYALGLSSLRFWPYFIASVLGSIPNLAVYIFGTAGVIHLVRTGIGQNAIIIGCVVLLVTTIGLLILQGFLRRHGRLADWKPDFTNEDSERS